MRYLSVVCLFAALIAAGTAHTNHDAFVGYVFAALFVAATGFFLFYKKLQ